MRLEKIFQFCILIFGMIKMFETKTSWWFETQDRKTWLNRAQSKLEEVVERHDDDIEQIERRLRYLEDNLS